MTFDDRISFTTPEGLEIEMNLAGLGSRIGAAIVDSIILGILLILAAFGLFGLADVVDSPLLVAGVSALVISLLVIGYFVAFEALNDGRTPGKSMFSLRAVGIDGEPVSFGASVVRNLLRLVDLFPALPILGPISILVSEHNQRIGDLAARTVVVRESRRAAHVPSAVPRVEPDTRLDVSGVSPADLEFARRFLDRRNDLTPAKRIEFADDLVGRFRRSVPGLDSEGSAERIIEQVVAAKLHRNQG